MNVYVWKRIAKATDNWHPEGGVVVFAATLERAHEIALEYGAYIDPDLEPPNQIRPTEGGEACYIMQDAGCC